MLIYWCMFILPVLVLISFRHNLLSKQKYPLFFIGVFFTLIVGFRYEVGCDWDVYSEYFYKASVVNDWQSLSYISTDLGYALLNFIAYRLVDDVWGVNLVAAIICMLGLFRFSLKQPNPALAFIVAIPYIVIVLFQGYTRQAAAFGFELFALVALSQSQYRKFVFYILIAATFHKTAAILLPLAALASSKQKGWTYFWIGMTSLFAFYFFIADYQDTLWENYVVADYQSGGGGIRIAMNVLPAILFLIFKNRFTFSSIEEEKIWFWISVISLACIPLVLQSSTAVDRVALYFLPIQIYVFTRLPIVFEDRKNLVISSTVLLYFLVQLVWLNFATHSRCWVPYHSFLF